MSWFSRRANLTNWPEPGLGHSLKNTDAQSKTYLRRNGYCFSSQSSPQKQNPSKTGQYLSEQGLMVRRFCVAIPLVGRKRHSLGAGTFNHATRSEEHTSELQS